MVTYNKLMTEDCTMIALGNDWDEILRDEFKKEYYLKIREFLKSEYSQRTIFPSMYDIFNALRYTSYGNTKVVILGQDPYHEIGQAHGLKGRAAQVCAVHPSPPFLWQAISRFSPSWRASCSSGSRRRNCRTVYSSYGLRACRRSSP